MKHTSFKSITSVALATSLVLSAVAPVYSASTTTTKTTQNTKAPAIANSVLGKVSIDGKSYFELLDVNLLSSSSGKFVSFKITVHNKSNKDIQLIDYWINLKSKSGSKYSVNIFPDDKAITKVSANSSQTLTYYSNIGNNLTLKDLKFDFIKWDFSKPNYERLLGSITVPTSYNPVTSINQKRSMKMGGTNVLSSIERLIMNKTDKYYKPSITFRLENNGTQSFTLPAYEYKLVTSKGITYPLTPEKGKENLVLNPKFNESIQLTGSVPIEIDSSGWTLLVALPIPDTKISLPIASYSIPQVTKEEVGTVGKKYNFSTAAGSYQATLNSIHRLPLEDSDILAANITLYNPGSETVKIPNLLGKFILDQNVNVTAKAVRSDQSIGIPAKSSVSLQLYANIPYNYSFTEIKTVLQEKDEDEKVIDLLEITSDSKFSTIETVAPLKKYSFDVLNKRADLYVRKVFTFEGLSSNVISVQMIADNLEKRYSNITALNAYFQTEDGTLYPASVDISDKKVSPSGSAVINFWKAVPKDLNASDLKLVVGEAIIGEDGKSTNQYVNPVQFLLPKEDNTIASALDEIEIFPYSVTLSKFNTQVELSSKAIVAKFNYNLQKNILVESNTEQHKLIVEISDENNNLKVSQEYPIGTGENALQIGEHEATFSKSDSEYFFKIESMRNFNLNIYYQFNGHKKLVATKQIRWFTTSD